MQLIWVAGPADKVVKLNLTRRAVVALSVTLTCALVALGVVLYALGMRVAVQYMPELAQHLGGVTSQTEQDKTEARYRAQLQAVHERLDKVADQLKKLEETKNEVLGRVGLGRLLSLSSLPSGDDVRGQGGPLQLLPSSWRLTDRQLDQQIDQSLKQAQRYDSAMASLHSRWANELAQLDAVPARLPMAGEFAITSSFGVRIDPITRLPSMHEGIDFVAPVGTPVLASAAGKVTKAEYAGAYGHLVEIAHADSFVTRYAHLQRIDVQVGDQVLPQTPIGSLGNTGRSTGPHLHYEVDYQGKKMHPIKAMAAWAHD
jgi:murein DD-endopeptidase MepM/ murein hydrolase activator NlpD